MNNCLLKKLVAECIGTFVLVFVACGVAVVTRADTVATSLAFGLVIVAMAYSIGSISGCHINPAVSLAMAIRKEISWKEFGLYVLAQTVGALIGALLLGIVLKNVYDNVDAKMFSSLGANQIQNAIKEVEGNALSGYTYKNNAMSYVSAFLVEVVLTCVFVMAILGVTDKKHHDGKHAGIVIGLALVLVHLLGLSFTGTSVNPARSFGPALFQAFGGEKQALKEIWIFILAPMAGGALATVLYTLLAGKKGDACNCACENNSCKEESNVSVEEVKEVETEAKVVENTDSDSKAE
ncbi:MAG: aquaporin [Acholeplasmatales bacterium]|nr:aquaporin [Acholeplasmatales bacterium]